MQYALYLSYPPEDGTNVPDFDGTTASVLAHDYFQKVHWNGSCYDQNEIRNEKGSATILETQVGESEIHTFYHMDFFHMDILPYGYFSPWTFYFMDNLQGDLTDLYLTQLFFTLINL